MIRRALARLIACGGLALALAACQTTTPGMRLAEPEGTEPLAPGADGTWYAAGITYLVAREPAQAERAFTRSLAREGVSARTLTALGVSVAQQGLLTQARRHLEQARALAPEDVRVHNNLGVVLYHLGEYDGARQAFQSAFLISSGRDEVASLNLERVEQAIALQRLSTDENPAISHRIERVGRGEYRLLEQSSEPAAAVPEADAAG